MRQITDYMEDYWATRGLDILVPSSSQLCERFAALEVSVRQRSLQLARRLASGEAITMIVDSTGLSFGRASEWYEQKYGRKATQTPWRKMHRERSIWWGQALSWRVASLAVKPGYHRSKSWRRRPSMTRIRT
jgi:hypothetical protein